MSSQEVTAPSLRFSPLAWAKLKYLCLLGDTEIGGFGVCHRPEDLLLVTDFVMVPQETSQVTVEFDDVGVANYFEDMVERGLKPAQFARVWIHTHPVMSPLPSGTDEETFAKTFGNNDWAVMFILARQGDTYARLRVNTAPGVYAQVEIDDKIHWGYGGPHQPTGMTPSDWAEEYKKNVKARTWVRAAPTLTPADKAPPALVWNGSRFAPAEPKQASSVKDEALKEVMGRKDKRKKRKRRRREPGALPADDHGGNMTLQKAREVLKALDQIDRAGGPRTHEEEMFYSRFTSELNDDERDVMEAVAYDEKMDDAFWDDVKRQNQSYWSDTYDDDEDEDDLTNLESDDNDSAGGQLGFLPTV